MHRCEHLASDGTNAFTVPMSSTSNAEARSFLMLKEVNTSRGVEATAAVAVQTVLKPVEMSIRARHHTSKHVVPEA